MSAFDTVLSAQFEPAQNNLLRLISFNHDPETGSKSVADILEIQNDHHGRRFLAYVAAGFTTQSITPCTYQAVMGRDVHGYNPDEKWVTLDECNTGRARKLTSRIQKMLEQM